MVTSLRVDLDVVHALTDLTHEYNALLYGDELRPLLADVIRSLVYPSTFTEWPTEL